MTPPNWNDQQSRTPTTTRACPVCPASSGVLSDEKPNACPACNRSGKVHVAPGERLALRFVELASRLDSRLSRSNRRRYHISIVCKAQMPVNAPPEYAQLVAAVDTHVWACSSEQAMVTVRTAALWDGIPRPFEITASRSYLIEDEVVQKTRSTCDEDKELVP